MIPRSIISTTILLLLIFIMSGCEKSPEPQFRFNAVERLSAERMNMGDGESISEQNIEKIGTVLTALFGTPDEPRFPFLLGEEDPAHEVLTMENLRMAAGPVSSDRDDQHTGLYREHCAHCHGISGDGAGPTARTLNPYPRDFRLGKFKFKSTPLGKRPTDHDLDRIIRNGIPGTAMPSFRTLSDEEVDALVDYVKYLSIRGEVERGLIAEASNLVDDEKLFDLSLAENEETLEDFGDQLFDLIDENGFNSRVLPKWLNRDRYITHPALAPPSFDVNHPDHPKLVAQGKLLFHGAGGCVQCHGETGLGDGQTMNFDDWTQWAKESKADPTDRSTYASFTAVGALPPRYVRPRNLNMKVFRGGNHPDDLYRRILNGIEGTPMPSATVLEKRPDDLWALVAYIRSIPFESERASTPKPMNSKPVN